MPASSTGMNWTDQTISTLRTLWSEGHSTAEIGRRMNTTKNTIVGKAHRLNLPARPSPILSQPRERVELTACAKPPPAPPPPSPLPIAQVPVPPAAAPARPLQVAPVVPPSPVPVRTPVSLPARSSTPAASRPANTCQWPIGEPGKPNFRFCGNGPAPGKPYCPDHCGRAYVRVRDGVSTAASS